MHYASTYLASTDANADQASLETASCAEVCVAIIHACIVAISWYDSVIVCRYGSAYVLLSMLVIRLKFTLRYFYHKREADEKQRIYFAWPYVKFVLKLYG